ncbi:MAG: hypothetical protein LBQ12_04965 [Deltaproteobacteria bacterium]|jgi:hypothetical protein|nr:hypothetical protein [Deltaproteobacteria bacterium]
MLVLELPDNCTVMVPDEKNGFQARERATGFARTRNGGGVRARNGTCRSRRVVNQFAYPASKTASYKKKYGWKR